MCRRDSLNPMDVELNMAAGESPLSMKADFLLSLCELVVGGFFAWIDGKEAQK